MDNKIGRNDPCPCGSGKKFKQCCYKPPGVKKKFTAKVITGAQQQKTAKQMPDLMERTFGEAIRSTYKEEQTPSLEKEQE